MLCAVNNDKLKKAFFDLLEDADIIEKIKEICGSQERTPVTVRTSAEDSSGRQQTLRLQAELDRARNVIADNESTIGKQNRAIDELNRKLIAIKSENESSQRAYAAEVEKNRTAIQTLQKENGTLQKENQTLRALAINFQKPLSLYQKYTALHSELKRNLAGIISDQTPLSFISSLSRYENLESLWEYIKYLIGSGNGEEIPVLKEIFEFFFLLMNDSSEKATYALSEVRIGSRYDDDLHIRGYGSAAQGTVREVQLPGYYSVNTGNIIKKSVVKAE